MKKIILGSVSAVIFAAIIGINVKMNLQEDKSMTDLNLANVEALASETEGGSTYYGYTGETARCRLELGGGWFTSSVKRICVPSYSPCVCTTVACGDVFYN